METLLSDLRYALRLMRSRIGFTVAAVLSLALGIGANTTIFTLAKAAFLETVPVKDASRVVMLFSTQNNPNGPEFDFLQSSYLNARDYREKNDVFSDSAIVIPMGATLTISGKDLQVPGELVNANFFQVIGIDPVLGRSFAPGEDQKDGASPVAVLSYAFWNKQFGADPNIIGKTVRVNQLQYTVIGVAPKEFHDAGGLFNPDFWVPISMHDQILTGIAKGWYTQRGARLVQMVARLKPGVTLPVAQASIRALATSLSKEYPTDNSGRGEQVVPINDTVIPPNVRDVAVHASTIMLTIVGLVLLIACANVANLLLSRATLRQREMAIRLSMGAKRSRLIRQLLTESLLLGLIAGAVAILFAFWGRSLIMRLLPAGLLPTLDFSLDARVLLFTLALSLVAVLLFGLMPAIQTSSANQLSALRDRSAVPSGGSTRWYGLRGLLVMAQVALSLVALVGAGLFVHSLRNAEQIDPGFEVKHELTMNFNFAAAHYPQPKAEQFIRDVVDRVRALPMVANASIADAPPLSGGLQRTTFPEGVDRNDPHNGRLTPVIAVQPGYFSTTGIALLRGRDFDDHDDDKSTMVAIVNQALVDRTWPGQDPIGKHLYMLGESWDIHVIGVATTVKYATMGEPPQPIVYFPLKQHYAPFVTLYVRTKGDPNAALGSIRTAAQSLDSTLPIRRVLTVSELLDQSLTAPRVGAELLGAFGILALILAAIGTYGVMSYLVNQRTQEIGVRMALGAQHGDVLRLILGNGMTMVVVGILIGFGGAALLARAMNTLLYGIGMFDSASFLGTALLLIAVALVACGIPARRAARVDPMVALRYE
ncbi:MAG TPA: ABC transporter permease [Terriglobales bacterium]|nr:ABC transporter permease [Terriglobales bacterium]